MRERVPLHRLTSLRIGGEARYFASPSSPEEATGILSWAEKERVSNFVLGAGTNVIFPDSGYPGLVISTRSFTGIRLYGDRIVAGSGEPLSRIAHLASRAGLSGLEWGCGIPGTTGGAVAMNAGAHGGDIASVLVEVEGASPSGPLRLSSRELRFGYRYSALLGRPDPLIVTSVTFELVESSPERTVSLARRLLEERRGKFPSGPSAGCAFKNPSEGPPAGELLDRAGCKGMRIGGAYVSKVHANFVMNDGERNASEVLELMERMQKRVKERFGLLLEPEIVICE